MTETFTDYPHRLGNHNCRLWMCTKLTSIGAETSYTEEKEKSQEQKPILPKGKVSANFTQSSFTHQLKIFVISSVSKMGSGSFLFGACVNHLPVLIGVNFPMIDAPIPASLRD